MLNSINIQSTVPVYKQIENHIQFAIAAGNLKADDRLPSVKELGARLGVNFNTVAKAYRDLEVMGLIYTRRGMGCYIKKSVDKICRDSCRKRSVQRIHEVAQEAKAAGMTKTQLVSIISKCLASPTGPYDPVPNSILVLAKRKAK